MIIIMINILLKDLTSNKMNYQIKLKQYQQKD